MDVIVFVGLNNFMDDFMDGMFSNDVSNSEIKKLLERILTRFENWRIEVERNPNPHMVHQLKKYFSLYIFFLKPEYMKKLTRRRV